jgi:hypothetical protein
MTATFPTPPDGSVTPAKLAGSPDVDVDQGIAWDGSAWVPVDLAAVAPDAVSSVNGQTGVVALTAADVGAQPSDADLTAIAALSTTSFGRGLLALADAAAGRTALGLGSAATSDASVFQAADSDLTAIAALTTTSYGRAFLALADAAAARTALALGTAALSASGDFQPIDSDLTAIAALTTTTFGRSLLTQADAAAVRTAIGAAASGGSVAASSVTFTAGGTIASTDAQAAIAEVATDAIAREALLAPLASPALTGSPTAPTQTAADNSTKIATTAYADAIAALKANLASPTFTGTPAAPTASARTGTTQLATTAYVDSADTTVTANTQTTSYTLVLGDAGKTIEMNSASATVVTIPPNSSVAFPVGTVIEICRIGAGSVTITDGSGVTIPNRLEAAGTTSRTIANQWSAATLRKRATDVWVLIGDIA